MSEQQRYHILSRIAAGGMAEVYRGESAGIEGFRKKVAIKRVLPKLSANQAFIEMFLDEARLGAYLNHSRCVQVFDIGQGNGAHFIVMEYVDGADLRQLQDHLTRNSLQLSVEVACFVALQICEGLAYAHVAKDHEGAPLDIVHRDISPQNVLMTRHGEVKLVDFGLAKASSHLAEEDEDIVKGKFGYLAPEVTLGQGADHRVDIFATGILLWEMIAGRRLFFGENDLDTFRQVREAVVPDLRQLRTEVNDEVMTVVLSALAKDPAQRYQTADDMAHDLGIVLANMREPVTYQDLAAFVRAVAEPRGELEKVAEGTSGDYIGDLILNELHAFSDVDDLPDSGLIGPTSLRAGSSDFVDPALWGLEEELGDGFLQERAAQSLRRVPSVPTVSNMPKAPSAAARRAQKHALRKQSLPPPRRGAEANGTSWKSCFED